MNSRIYSGSTLGGFREGHETKEIEREIVRGVWNCGWLDFRVEVTNVCMNNLKTEPSQRY